MEVHVRAIAFTAGFAARLQHASDVSATCLQLPNEGSKQGINVLTIVKPDRRQTAHRKPPDQHHGCQRIVCPGSTALQSGETIANRLIRFHGDQGANGKIELPYDKRTLASLLGMTPENLSRAFNTLKPYGVQVDGAVIHLRDMAAPKTLAKANPLIDDRTT